MKERVGGLVDCIVSPFTGYPWLIGCGQLELGRGRYPHIVMPSGIVKLKSHKAAETTLIMMMLMWLLSVTTVVLQP